jgi:hypothetical protein
MKVLLQYVPDLQANNLNVRVGFNTGHPSNLLRYFQRRSGNHPKLSVPMRIAKDVNAATTDVPAQQLVLTLSAKNTSFTKLLANGRFTLKQKYFLIAYIQEAAKSDQPAIQVL